MSEQNNPGTDSGNDGQRGSGANPPAGNWNRLKAWIRSHRAAEIALYVLLCLILIVAVLVVSTRWGPVLLDFMRESPGTAWLVALLVGGLIAFRFRLPQRWQGDRDLAVTLTVLSVGAGFGLYLITAACGFADAGSQSMVARTAIGWALGYCAAGFLTGFLFGIPKVLQTDNPAAGANGYAQRVNTNLEQISDWLTKIIVGLGLVELRSVPDHIYKASQWMARSFTPTGAPTGQTEAAAASVAGAFIIFFSVLGFLTGYLTTRLYFAGAFKRADLGEVVEEPDEDFDSVQPTDQANMTKLRDFWKPGGNEDATNRDAILLELKNRGNPDLPLDHLVNYPEYEGLRKAIVTALNLP